MALIYYFIECMTYRHNILTPFYLGGELYCSDIFHFGICRKELIERLSSAGDYGIDFDLSYDSRNSEGNFFRPLIDQTRELNPVQSMTVLRIAPVNRGNDALPWRDSEYCEEIRLKTTFRILITIP